MSDMFPEPSIEANTFTIYSINSCPYCINAIELLSNDRYIIIKCDDYKKNNRNEFLDFMDKITLVKHRTFPMIFHETKFIGGFTDLKIYHKKLNLKIIEVDDF